MKNFLAGFLAGFILASLVALLCFRYQLVAVSASSIPFAYRLNRLTGHTDLCFMRPFPEQPRWRAVAEPAYLDAVPDPFQPTSVQP